MLINKTICALCRMINNKFIYGLSLLFVITPVLSFVPTAEQTMRLEHYFQYLNTYPNILGPIGSADNGEIEIVQDMNKILEIEKNTGCRVGVLAEDKYRIWFNDAVKFPNNKYVVYGRYLWKNSLQGKPAIAVLPILPNGNVILIRNFRHATRSWEYELPRGGREQNETIEDAAKREVKEETGFILDELVSLGEIAVDSGTLNTIMTVISAKVIDSQQSTAEDTEVIAAADAFSISELKAGYVKGCLDVRINGERKCVPLRDPFLAYALFMLNV